MERGCRNGNEKRGTRNKERGRGAGNGKWENEKFETKPKQRTGNKASLLKVHEFNFGFVPTFQLLVSYAHSPVPVSGFRIIPLKRSK